MEACVINSDSILISFLALQFISLHATHYFIFRFASTASRLCARRTVLLITEENVKPSAGWYDKRNYFTAGER